MAQNERQGALGVDNRVGVDAGLGRGDGEGGVMIDKMRQTALKIQRDLEHELFFGQASTCASDPVPPLTHGDVRYIMDMLRAAHLTVWYVTNEWLPEEIDGKPCEAMTWRTGDDNVLIVRPDDVDNFKAAHPHVNFVEYSQERAQEAAEVDFKRMLERHTLRCDLSLARGDDAQ